MRLYDLLVDASMAVTSDIDSKKRALEHLAQELSKKAGSESNSLLSDFLVRERQGSTCLGCGVAIPHVRAKIAQPIATLLRLETPIAFDHDPNADPVDLFCALLVPEEATDSHLKILAQLAQFFGKKETRDALRECDNPRDLHTIALKWAATLE